MKLLRRLVGLGLGLVAMSAASMAQPPTEITVIEEQKSAPLPTPSQFSQQVKKQKGPWMREIASFNMAPTLIYGDRVAMVKLREKPMRGDVVLLEHTRDGQYWFMERIIGLPGDVVQMKGGRLFLNGQEVKRNRIRTVTYNADGSLETATEYEEQIFGEDRPHLIHELSDHEAYDDTPAFNVPDGHFFVMGDNRDNSEDSRAPTGHRALFAASPNGWSNRAGSLPLYTSHDAIGFVPAENLISRADRVMFSLNSCRLTDKMKAAAVECLKPRIGERL